MPAVVVCYGEQIFHGVFFHFVRLSVLVTGVDQTSNSKLSSFFLLISFVSVFLHSVDNLLYDFQFLCSKTLWIQRVSRCSVSVHHGFLRFWRWKFWPGLFVHAGWFSNRGLFSKLPDWVRFPFLMVTLFMFAAHKETRRQSQKQNEATTLTLSIDDVEEVLALERYVFK